MSTFDLRVTEKASRMLRDTLDPDSQTDHAVRVVARRYGVRRFRYSLDVVSADDAREDDQEIVLDNGVKLWIDPPSASALAGASVDFVDKGGLRGAGFAFDNPQERAGFDDPLERRLQALLDDEINPGIAAHGGVIELVEVKEGIAYLHMGGGCQGCGSAAATLAQGVEVRVRELFPEITGVVDITVHSQGQNPYYPSGRG